MVAATENREPIALSPGRPVVEIIRDLRSGVITGRALDGESRRACVMYLGGEGYGVPEIAALLKVSDRTVARDRARMREELAVERDPGLLPRMVGHLIGEAESTSVRLRRIARDKTAPASARVEAEKATWGIMCDLVRTLQSVGYLPQAPKPVRISARVANAGEDEDIDAPALEELITELARIEGITAGPGASVEKSGGEQEPTELTALRLDLGRLAVAARMSAIERMIGTTTQGRDTDEDDELGHDDERSDDHEHTGKAAEPCAERTATKRTAPEPLPKGRYGNRRTRPARAG